MCSPGNELGLAQNKFVNVLTIKHGTSDSRRTGRMELQGLGGNGLSPARLEVRSSGLPGVVLRHDRDQLAVLPDSAAYPCEVVGPPRGRKPRFQVHHEGVSRLYAR